MGSYFIYSEWFVVLELLKARSNAFVALISLDGQRDISSANLPVNTRGTQQQYSIVCAPSLQFVARYAPIAHPGKCLYPLSVTFSPRTNLNALVSPSGRCVWS
jgi:hypothetical protein